MKNVDSGEITQGSENVNKVVHQVGTVDDVGYNLNE